LPPPACRSPSAAGSAIADEDQPVTVPSLGDLAANTRERLSFLSPEDSSTLLGGTAERTFRRGSTAGDKRSR
jgi:hypothetical protein